MPVTVRTGFLGSGKTPLPALMGLDHEKLTYRYAGRDFRLADFVPKDVFA